MKRLRQKKLITVGFGLALVVLSAIDIVSYRNTIKLSQTADAVTHSYRILAELRGIVCSVKDVEIGQRGYILTGEESCLESYYPAIETMASAIRNLRSLTTDNPSQQHRLDTLERHMAERLALAQQTIQVRRTQGFEAARQALRADEGPALTSAIAGAVAAMESEEDARLKQRSEASRASTGNMRFLLFVESFLSLGLLILLYYIYRQEIVEYQQVQAVLGRAHDELERRVLERTKDLEETNETLQAEIAERQRAEATIRESERRWRSLLENVRLVAVATDRNGDVEYVNPFFLELTGYTREEVLGKPWLDRLIPERERSALRKAFAEVSDTDRPPYQQYPICTKAGTERLIAWYHTRLLDSQGQALGTLSLGEDVTERKRMEAALVESKVMFEKLFELSPDALVVSNRAGVIVQLNSQAEQMFGYSRHELLGKTIEVLIPERFRQQHVAHRAGYHSELRVRTMGTGMELYVRHRDGREFPADIMLGPLETGDNFLVLNAVRDITERKDVETRLALQAWELARSNAELEQFAYIASHDLQEPLRTVAGHTQLLARRYKGKLGADADKFINYAVDGVTHMQALISDLLTYSRVSTQTAAPTPVDSEAVFNRVLSNLHVAIKKSAAVITYDPLPTVMGNDTQLGQLFQNLIANAIKYRGPDPPRIHVSAEAQDKAWLFSVRDNGIGLDMKYAERIFVIFQRLHGRKDYPGTGIGLALCKKIIERHGGRIWVESALGKGSTFYFTWPREGKEPPPSAGRPPGAPRCEEAL